MHQRAAHIGPRIVDSRKTGGPESVQPPKNRRRLALFQQTLKQFVDDDCPTMGAALAYYTTLSLAPLLLVVISIAGTFLGRDVVEGSLHEQLENLVGTGAADQISTMLQNAVQNRSKGVWSAIIGVIAILIGATSAFGQLQAALNRAWQVEPDPKVGVVKGFIIKRLLSLGMVLCIGFFLLVSLAVSTALAWMSSSIQNALPGFLSAGILEAINMAVSVALFTILFAAIFKVLPDANVEWRDVWVGALLTSVLFAMGKSLIGLYLGQSGLSSTYGAAGSLVVILLWVYYASLILLLGAEFTDVWAERSGKAVQPEPGAVHPPLNPKALAER